jgi:polyisoprenoid-binding protein YceI
MRLSGSFSLFEGTIFTTQDQLHSRASATVTVASVRTGMEGRDKAIRSVKLFNTEKHPVATYRTMDIRPYGDGYEVDGPMTLAGESRLVTFVVRVDAATDAVLDLKAETLLSRADFGIRLNARPAFLDRAVADTVGLSMRIRATAATTEGYPSQ